MVFIIDPQNAGISGNMTIGALVDMGADLNKVSKLMEDVTSDFGEVKVSIEKVKKAGIDSSFCSVKVLHPEHEHNHHMHFGDFIEKIDLLRYAEIENLSDEMVDKAMRVFARIAISESRVHGSTIEDVHFHEVGAVDAVADVFGSICAFYDLEIDNEKVVGLPIAIGGGTVKSTHGVIPVPAPASLNILKGLNDINLDASVKNTLNMWNIGNYNDISKGEAHCFGGPVARELATPTGCALYMELCDEFLEFQPMMSPDKIAYGCGSKDFDFPNVLRVIKSKVTNEKHRVSVIETNIDHMSGEELGFLFDLLLIEGARDVSMVPIVMKKNRPGHLIKIISKPSLVDHLVDILFRETGTLGIRISENTHRGVAERQFIPIDIEVKGHVYTINFKIGLIGDEIISYRPEYEDLRRISVEQDIPLVEIREVANTMIRDFLENGREED